MCVKSDFFTLGLSGEFIKIILKISFFFGIDQVFNSPIDSDMVSGIEAII